MAGWLLVEQPGPWGRDAVTSSRLDPAVGAALLERARAAGVRVLLVRRPGRSPLARYRRWARVDSRPAHESVRWGRFADDRELLDLPGDAAAGTPSGDPLYLVCAHARHDPCCATQGRPVAAALAEAHPALTWECSHLGGCRFAANLLVLPHGLYYGHASPGRALAAVAAHRDGLLVPEDLRGRSALPAPVQAAQHHARLRLRAAGTPADGVDDLAPLRVAPAGERTWRVSLAGPAGEVALVVRDEPAAAPAPLTCAARTAAAPRRWVLVDA
nr:sucrase ferredoxin [Vallicoccus soli]